ncbi:DUF5658 family protein [Salirhabdus sp. Marseille-P4669]|uniref:DUF5658 family protein n=1 Tax=Salirhabdus sp. Marseille-P4669 TaxID=2042310 RepID=UPI000C7AC023|nr:DUF5658 family protein [Salirhabdus sp. Marseille-P4669]
MFVLYLIALLNVLDLVLTTIGLQFHIIEEVNPFMSGLWKLHPFVFIGVKISLSLLLIYCAHYLTNPTLKSWRVLTGTAIGLYVSVLVMHGVWLVQIV